MSEKNEIESKKTQKMSECLVKRNRSNNQIQNPSRASHLVQNYSKLRQEHLNTKQVITNPTALQNFRFQTVKRMVVSEDRSTVTQLVVM